jgi:hypothetical protein
MAPGAESSCEGTRAEWAGRAFGGSVSLAALWIGKKAVVLALARLYGFKRIYRRGLEANNHFLRNSPSAHARAHSIMRITMTSTLKVLSYFDTRSARSASAATRRPQSPKPISDLSSGSASTPGGVAEAMKR